MSEKPFSLGILVGRFQTLHAGHEDMIRTCMALCSRTAVFIGSSQESGTRNNPFSYELRAEMLHTLLGDDLPVYPLPDIGAGNNSGWGSYVLENVRKCTGCAPDLLVSGKEARRVSWFDGLDVTIAELYIPKTIDISATKMREFFLADDELSWRRYTSPELWPRYRQLRALVLAAKDRTETASL